MKIFVYNYILLLLILLCSSDNPQYAEVETNFIKENDTSTLLSFSFNVERFDDFVFNINQDALNLQLCETKDKNLVSACNTFYNIFCIIFQYSELLKNDDFFDEFDQVFSSKIESFVMSTPECNYTDVLDSVNCESFAAMLVDKILDKNDLSKQFISFEEINDRIFITCSNKAINTLKEPEEDLTAQNSYFIRDNESISSLSRNSIINKFIKKKSSLSKTEDYGVAMIRFLLLTTGIPLDQVLINILVELINVVKNKKQKKKYFKKLNNIKKNLKNPKKCIKSLKELFRTSLKDINKIKFKAKDSTEEIVNDLVEKFSDLLKL